MTTNKLAGNRIAYLVEPPQRTACGYVQTVTLPRVCALLIVLNNHKRVYNQHQMLFVYNIDGKACE